MIGRAGKSWMDDISPARSAFKLRTLVSMRFSEGFIREELAIVEMTKALLKGANGVLICARSGKARPSAAKCE
ncbi:MAG: hypothetical protein CMN61_09260 [Sphingobium sp.]|nr:hypothetical protein [Sphingobium sp.]